MIKKNRAKGMYSPAKIFQHRTIWDSPDFLFLFQPRYLLIICLDQLYYSLPPSHKQHTSLIPYWYNAQTYIQIGIMSSVFLSTPLKSNHQSACDVLKPRFTGRNSCGSLSSPYVTGVFSKWILTPVDCKYSLLPWRGLIEGGDLVMCVCFATNRSP